MSFVLLGILNSQAAGGGGLEDGFVHLATANAGGSSQISFSGISQDYTHLCVRMSFGADGQGGYDFNTLQSDKNDATNIRIQGTTYQFIALNNQSGRFRQLRGDFQSNPALNQSTTWFTNYSDTTVAGSFIAYNQFATVGEANNSGWKILAASDQITSARSTITLFADATLRSGSTASLYGVL